MTRNHRNSPSLRLPRAPLPPLSSSFLHSSTTRFGKLTPASGKGTATLVFLLLESERKEREGTLIRMIRESLLGLSATVVEDLETIPPSLDISASQIISEMENSYFISPTLAPTLEEAVDEEADGEGDDWELLGDSMILARKEVVEEVKSWRGMLGF